MSKDYYKILGVPKGASQEDIKRAYKELAKKHHPDLNKDHGSEDKFKEINEAYQVLGDEKNRQRYDRFGTADQGFQAGTAGFDFSDFGGMEFDLGDIFEGFFGGGGGRRRRNRGSDMRVDIELTLEEAYKGIKKDIQVKKYEKCDPCKGSGAKSPDDIIQCTACNGIGQVKKSQRTPFGYFSTTSMCSECSGSGKMIKSACKECSGKGRVMRSKSLSVKIPAGIEEGTSMVMHGEGEAVKDGQPGDLYVVVHIKKHEIFERDGEDVLLTVPISFVQAALGDEIEIPTLSGKVDMKIPEGTQTNTIFRMKGKGMPIMDSDSFGDQMVTVIIRTPEKMSKKQRKLLEDFAKESGEEVSPQKSFFKKWF